MDPSTSNDRREQRQLELTCLMAKQLIEINGKLTDIATLIQQQVDLLRRILSQERNMTDQLPVFLQDMLLRRRKPVKASTAGYSELPANFTRICLHSKLCAFWKAVSQPAGDLCRETKLLRRFKIRLAAPGNPAVDHNRFTPHQNGRV